MATRRSDPEVADVKADRRSVVTESGPSVRLPSAGGSTDPAVHHLIAELGTARSNGDTAAEAAILGRLQALGYSA